MEYLMTVLLLVAPGDEIRAHADAILDMQFSDGAIVHFQKGDEIMISPYFGNYAALGLFEAYRVTDDEKYLDAGVAWTDWYLEHMDVYGVVHDHTGTRATYSSTGHVDSTDSYAATFLMCANVRRGLTGDWRFVVREKPKLWKTYVSMLSTADVDGLTYARADYPFKLTADNAEVYEGLWHAKQLAHVLRAHEWNRQVYYARRKIDKSFDELRGDDGLYAWKKGSAAEFAVAEAGEFYPTGLANLMAVALGPHDGRKGKETVQRTYALHPDLASCAADQLYWWYAAAREVHRNDLAKTALEMMKGKVDARGLAVDHAHYIRALASYHRLDGKRKPKHRRVPMGSTFIDVPRQATR